MLTLRRLHGTGGAGHRALAAVLDRPRYEVLPLPGVEDEVVRHNADATVAVTASPRRGLEATLLVTRRLAERGVTVVPHLSARLVRDEAHLKEILDELTEVGVGEVFVIGGDVDAAVGPFDQALDLLQAMDRLGYDLTVGVAGYPEAHPTISDDVTVQALWDKRHYADYVVSQVCFDAAVVVRWVRRLRARGVALPVLVGVPGPVSTRQLLRVSHRIGVGTSLRFLSHQGRGMLRVVQPGRWRPDPLLERLAPYLTEQDGIRGIHLYTFNDLAAAEQWRRAAVRRFRPEGDTRS
jgi:methylenetetrahydrofolate reductase (NADPH)